MHVIDARSKGLENLHSFSWLPARTGSFAFPLFSRAKRFYSGEGLGTRLHFSFRSPGAMANITLKLTSFVS